MLRYLFTPEDWNYLILVFSWKFSKFHTKVIIPWMSSKSFKPSATQVLNC